MEGHSDAGMDRDLFLQMLQQEVAPVIQHLVKMIEAQDEEIKNLKHVVNGIVTGFDEALSGHRRGSLMESVNLGDDYDDINGVYKDWEGSDLKEDLIDYIMENNISDEDLEDMIQTVQENARGKYGKYVKPKETSVEIAVGTEPSMDSEEPDVEEEKPASEPVEDKFADKDEDDAGTKVWKQMMKMHRSARGTKL